MRGLRTCRARTTLQLDQVLLCLDGETMNAAQPVLTVKSVHSSIQWYEQIFGLSATFRNERPGEPNSVNYAVLRLEDAEIHLGLERDMENAAGQGAMNLVTNRFDEVLENCRAAGARFFIEPSTIPTGQRTFGVKDPDGNLVTVVEHDAGT